MSPPPLGKNPAEASASLEQAQKLFKDGRADEALRFLALACADAQTCKSAMPYIADCFLLLDEPEKAADFFRSVADRYPQIAGEARGYRAFFLVRAFDFIAGYEEYQEALASAPSAKFYNSYSKLLLEMGDIDGAVEAYKEALRLEPGFPESRFQLAKVLMRKEDFAGARLEAQLLVTEHPEYADGWTLLGRLRLIAGNREGAEIAFQQAIQCDQKNIKGRYWLARIALRAGDTATTRRYLQEVFQIEAGLGRGRLEE